MHFVCIEISAGRPVVCYVVFTDCTIDYSAIDVCSFYNKVGKVVIAGEPNIRATIFLVRVTLSAVVSISRMVRKSDNIAPLPLTVSPLRRARLLFDASCLWRGNRRLWL